MAQDRSAARKLTFASCIVALAALCTASMSAEAAPGRPSNWRQANADAADSNRNPGETDLSAAGIDDAQFMPVYSLAGLPIFGQCGGGFVSVPVMSATRMYVYNGREVDARNLATGELAWTSPNLAGSPVGSRSVTNVALAGDRVVAAGISSCISLSDPDGFVVGLDVSTGDQVWSVATPHRTTALSVSGTTALVAGAADRGGTPSLTAYDVGDGAVLWSRDDCGETGTLFIVDTTVATGDCGALDLDTGETIWNKSGWQLWRGDGPSIANPSIYATKPAGELAALHPDGTVRWTADTSYAELYAAGPARVFAKCDGDGLCALDRATGDREWKVSADFAPGAQVVLASDFVIWSVDGSILRSFDGKQLGFMHDPEFGGWDWMAVAAGKVIGKVGRDVDVFALSP